MCIQGDWSNLADAKIKGGIASLALGDAPGSPYNPLYARASHTPKPWGVTALFTEYTGVHEPLALDWTLKASSRNLQSHRSELTPDEIAEEVTPIAVAADERPWPPAPATAEPASAAADSPDRRAAEASPPFETLWDFVKALNRSDRIAVDLAANQPQPDLAVDGLTVKKLLGTFWFRSMFPQLSESWRERMLEALAENVVIPNHPIRCGRQAVHLADLSYGQMKEISAKTLVRGAAGTDLQLLLAIGNLWGEQAFRRLRFVEIADQEESSRLAALLGFR